MYPQNLIGTIGVLLKDIVRTATHLAMIDEGVQVEVEALIVEAEAQVDEVQAPLAEDLVAEDLIAEDLL